MEALNGITKKCAAKAAELLLSYSGEYTTAGVMLLVHEAVLSGAQLGVEECCVRADKAIDTVTGSAAP